MAGSSEDKANNNVCFLFAQVLLYLTPFSTREPCTDLRAMF
jgi:hypothetical protein